MRAAALLLFAGSAAAGSLGPVSAPPTASPECPVELAISSPAHQCNCDIVDSNTMPWISPNGPNGLPLLGVSREYCPGTMPSEFNGAIHLTCPHCLRNDTQFNITCPNSWAACDIYLLVYHCPSCFSSRFNGGWVQNLGQEWTPKRCAPKFCFIIGPGTPEQYPMVAFNKQVAGGDLVELPATTTQMSYFFSMIVKEIPAVCSNITAQGSCTGLCTWDMDNSVCVNAFCPPAEGSGPACPPWPCPTPDCSSTTAVPTPPVISDLPPEYRVERVEKGQYYYE
eukprot:TRINITY_DN2633_c0_g1_i11.p1 TRINITY_DN2633_c0_g1~~TRINITY_DN2633_c0_g1_i11.p1  ORF type:complete len:311 (+),score=102.00 TRINITY_DN2633_c0_g1_i11:93-935(+)